jgi:hypothetical protein
MDMVVSSKMRGGLIKGGKEGGILGRRRVFIQRKTNYLDEILQGLPLSCLTNSL